MGKFAKPYFVTPHAVERFRERIADIPPADVIVAVQAMLQSPGLPIDADMRDGKLGLTYRGAYDGKTVYMTVTHSDADKGDWPVVVAIKGADGSLHRKLTSGRPRGRTWNEDYDTPILVALRERGHTHLQCAAIMRWSKNTIWRHLRSLGITRGHRRWTEKEHEKLIRMCAAGKSCSEIAKKLGRSDDAIKVAISRHRKRIRSNPDALRALKVLSFCLNPDRVLRAVRDSGIMDELRRREEDGYD